MDLRSRGITGTNYLAVLCQSLECQDFSVSLDSGIYEFSRQGFPNIRTVDFWLGGNKAERFPQSRFVSDLKL